MANDIKVGVGANTKGVESGLDNTEKGVKKVTKTVDDLGKAARKTAKEIDQIEVSARRLERVQKILQTELGRNVSPGETREFLGRFDAMRNNRHLSGGSKIRQFGSFEDWHAGNRGMFVDPREADRYRRRVIGMASGGHIPGPPDRNQTPSSSLMQGGMRGAMRLAGPLMALSGIAGLMSMAGRGIDQAKDEATSVDQLLRSIGDTTDGFVDLRTEVRRSTDGLGIAFTEAAQMARQFTKEANAGPGTNVGGFLSTGMGMGRSFGIDPSVGVGFLAQMRHYGTIGSDDHNGRRMALMISEAIAKGGTTAKADEVLSAVAGFTSQVAKLTLTAPNAMGFAGALSGLTSSHVSGLDPANAANMLMTANAAMMRGGAMGEASQNFTYGMLSRENGDLSPVVAMMIAEQGMFGSGKDLFKTNGSGAMSPLGRFLAERGYGPDSFSGQSNMELLREEMRRQYGNSPIAVDAFKNHLGLSSYQQAAALYQMPSMQIGAVNDLMSRSGINIQNIDPTSLQSLGEISAQSTMSGLSPYVKRVRGMGLNMELENAISYAQEAGDVEGVKMALAKALEHVGQQENRGTETRNSVAEFQNTLTAQGERMLGLTNTIRDGVVRIANTIAPEDKSNMQLGRDAVDLITDIHPLYRQLKKVLPESWFGGGEDQTGMIPEGSPAAPGQNGKVAVDLNVTGLLNDAMGRQAGTLDQATTTVTVPLAAGTNGR